MILVLGPASAVVAAGTIPTLNPPASLRRNWWHVWHVPTAIPTRGPGFLQGGSTTPANPWLQQAAAPSKQLEKIQWDLFAWIQMGKLFEFLHPQVNDLDGLDPGLTAGINVG